MTVENGLLQIKTKEEGWIDTEFSGSALFNLDGESGGFCLLCGEYEEGRCEPDAVGYECSNCGEMELCGVSYLVMCGLLR